MDIRVEKYKENNMNKNYVFVLMDAEPAMHFDGYQTNPSFLSESPTLAEAVQSVSLKMDKSVEQVMKCIELGSILVLNPK